MYKLIILIAIPALLLVSCAQASNNQLIQTANPQEVTATSTSTPTFTASPTPTATATSTATPIPLPTFSVLNINKLSEFATYDIDELIMATLTEGTNDRNVVSDISLSIFPNILTLKVDTYTGRSEHVGSSILAFDFSIRKLLWRLDNPNIFDQEIATNPPLIVQNQNGITRLFAYNSEGADQIYEQPSLNDSQVFLTADTVVSGEALAKSGCLNCGRSASILLQNYKDGTTKQLAVPGNLFVNDVVASPDLHFLFIAEESYRTFGADYGLMIWNLENDTVKTINIPGYLFPILEISDDGNWIAAGSNTKVVVLEYPFKYIKYEFFYYVPLHVAFSHDSRMLAVGDLDNQISFYNLNSGTLISSMDLQDAGIWAFDFDPSQQFFVVLTGTRQQLSANSTRLVGNVLRIFSLGSE